jgi:hypothetical protein
MDHVRLLAREEIVEADHVVPQLDQSLAEMGTEKPGSAGHENPLDGWHDANPFVSEITRSLSAAAAALPCLQRQSKTLLTADG